MPYASNADLPASVRRALPWDAQVIFREAFNWAFDSYHGDEATAFRIAWTAVKRRYEKVEGHWLPKWVFEA
jgi:cation transport regulator